MFLSPRHVDLVTLRLHVPKSFVSVERWKACKERPVEGAKEWLGKVKCHSVYGWREHTQKSWKGKEEIFLCGYMKVQRDVVASVLELSGRHGVFVDRLATDQVQRPNISWIDRKDDRMLLTTLLCVKLPKTSLVQLLFVLEEVIILA